jgi:hypothetical protein
MSAYRVSYQVERGATREPEQVMCQRCLDALDRLKAWGVHSMPLTVEQTPKACEVCRRPFSVAVKQAS